MESGDWVSLLFVLIGALIWMFQAIIGWKPNTPDQQERESENLDDIFGPDESFGDKPPTRPAPGEQPSIEEDAEFAEALGIPVKRREQAKEQQKPPAQVRQLVDPSRPSPPPPIPPEVPATGSTQTAPPPIPPVRKSASAVPMWEKRLAESRASHKMSDKDRRLAAQFEKQRSHAGATKTSVSHASAGDPLDVRSLLSNPQSARTAIILREVLGRAPGMQPIGQSSGWEAEAR